MPKRSAQPMENSNNPNTASTGTGQFSCPVWGSVDSTGVVGAAGVVDVVGMVGVVGVEGVGSVSVRVLIFGAASTS